MSASAGLGADPIGDAARAETAGFDFVSTNDHPGSEQPCFEVWTLLSWIATSTRRIAVMPRVLAVPLRLPAMVAKQAESFDRLSNGRLILGLGAGSSDEELTGYGVRQLSPREKVDGLGETASIIRRLWNEPSVTEGDRSGRRDGAHLEPKPSHRIPIWFGTFGPRALELTGRLADGWIPSLGYAPLERLGAMRLRVLDAAERAGRDRTDIRCVLNLEVHVADRDRGPRGDVSGPPEEVVECLSEFVDSGFSGFNFVADGERTAEQIDRLGYEVLPLARQLDSSVAKAR